MTRPILTPSPTSTFTPNAPTELLSANSRLSFGEIVGLVAVATVVLGVVGWCVVLGPRRVLRKIGLKKKSKSKEEQLEWEADEEKSDEGHKRASVGAASDWWSLRAPAGALESRMSSVSVGGPGMAGVGAGSRMTPNSSEGSNTNDQAPPLQESIQPERRGTVRSGWFSASMVRGASLLSLGSVLKPEPAVSRVGQGQGGSAGRRFQELYRRERATEMGEHTHAPGTSRVPYPAVKRPSRLGTVPTILVQDATLPSLSSASHVTGRGYDADVERIY
ncbi:hypothetical protein FRC07_014161 [Ceratobasidium sp. 392]|nr:hypothetical protein FRC07_014161 [Ceratobasidium sp. 392]